MTPLVVRTQEELAAALAAIIEGVRSGIETGNGGRNFAQAPEYIDIEGVFLVEANVGTVVEQTIQPETTQTTTEVTPSRTVTASRTSTQTTSETAIPSGTTTTRGNSGSNQSETTREYQDVT